VKTLSEHSILELFDNGQSLLPLTIRQCKIALYKMTVDFEPSSEQRRQPFPTSRPSKPSRSLVRVSPEPSLENASFHEKNVPKKSATSGNGT